MKREVGLWIDHRKAVIVTIAYNGTGIKHLDSKLEKHVSFFPEEAFPEGVRDSRFADFSSGYYDDIIAHLRDADSIQIFGPDNTKHELEKQLKYRAMNGRIVNIETVEKMTDRQIEAKVWRHFLSPS